MPLSVLRVLNGVTGCTWDCPSPSVSQLDVLDAGCVSAWLATFLLSSECFMTLSALNFKIQLKIQVFFYITILMIKNNYHLA